MNIEFTKEQLEKFDELQNEARVQLIAARDAAQAGLKALNDLKKARTDAEIEFYKAKTK